MTSRTPIQHSNDAAPPALLPTPTVSITQIGEQQGIVRVRPGAQVMSMQRLPTIPGVSAATAGATALSMKLVVVPPGGAAIPHSHQGFETAIYCLSGRVETRYGPGLRQSVVCEAGDFLFIGPDVPHQPINLSATEPAMAIVARNDPSEHETIVPYDPADE
jgi:uncharacterized RmlC-like cupin family protein